MYPISSYHEAVWWEFHTSQFLAQLNIAFVMLLAKWSVVIAFTSLSTFWILSSHLVNSRWPHSHWAHKFFQSSVGDTWCAVTLEDALTSGLSALPTLCKLLRRSFRLKPIPWLHSRTWSWKLWSAQQRHSRESWSYQRNHCCGSPPFTEEDECLLIEVEIYKWSKSNTNFQSYKNTQMGGNLSVIVYV